MPLVRRLALLAVSYMVAACSPNDSATSGPSTGSSDDGDAGADANDAGSAPCWLAANCTTRSPTGDACGTDVDCAPDLFCGFDISAGCSARGSCQLRSQGGGECSSDALHVLCTCDDFTTTVCSLPLPGEPVYGPPSKHLGACDGQCFPACSTNEACVDHACHPLCTSDNACTGGTKCNAATVCLPPPGCHLPDGGVGDGGCPAVCYGYCE